MNSKPSDRPIHADPASPTTQDVFLNEMMPVVNNPGIDRWIHALIGSENVPPERIERVCELAREANMQWKRKVLVQNMTKSVQRDRRRAVPIQDIFDVYGVHFTTETMYILEDGIQQSLRNFCRMLKDVLSTWDNDCRFIHDSSFVYRSVSLAVSHAASCLWGSLDSINLCQATVHGRLLRAVDGLWNTHATPAIEYERNNLAEGIQRLGVMAHACDEYLKPDTGGMVAPSRFSWLYCRIQQRAIAALAWLLGNSSFVNRATDREVVNDMITAYKLGEAEARFSMDKHAIRVRQMVEATIRTLESIYNHDTQWHGWHGVLVWGGDSSPPHATVTPLIVQPPSYASSFWETSRVYCGVLHQAADSGSDYQLRCQPVVRFCAMLRQLVQKHFLRLDLVGVDYLRLLSHADHARYHRNVNKIVEDELVPVGHLAGHDFDMAWFLETRVPVVYNTPMPHTADRSLVLADDEEAKQDVTPDSPDTGQTYNCKSVSSREKQPSLPAPIPEGVCLDHCLMGVISLLSKSNVSGNHMGPYCNTFHIGTSDVQQLVRSAMGADSRAITDMCLIQRLSGVFKMFGAALVASGMQASFGVDKSHPREKKLKVSWPMGEQHRAQNLKKVSLLAEDIASHLHHGSVLPAGVVWNIPERSRRRRMARDAKCATEVLLSRC